VATTDIANAAAKVFTATLNAGTSEYTIDFDRPLDNGSTSASDFTSLAAGNTPWKGLDTTLLPDGTHPAIGDPEVGAANDSTDLLFTGYNAGGLITINTDNDDIGTGGGQKVNANEYLRVDIVQDLRRDAGQSESNAGGYTYDDHVGQKVFSFSTVDVQGNAAQTATILVRAWNVNDASATAQSDVNNAGINTQVDIDPASVVVHSAGGTLLVEGVGYNVVEFGNAIYVSGLHDGDVVTFQATGGATFEAVTLENGSGDANPEGGTFGGNPVGLGGFAFGANDPGDPVEFSLPTLLTDGDGDQSSGTVDVTVYPVGQVPTTLAATGSLFSANDNNSFEQQKLFANGTNTVLMGALAAAGLASDPIAANAIGKDSATDPQAASVAVNDTSSVPGDSQSSPDPQSSSSTLVGDAPQEQANASGGGAPSDSTQPAHDNALDAPQQDNSAPAELLQGTDAPAQAEATANPFTADAIQMPAADQLVAKDGGAVAGDHGGAVAGDNVQHNAVVGQVLADALNGGDSPHIEAALNAVTGAGDAATAANDALASHGSAAVSNGDMPDLAAFIAAHGVGMVAPMEMHHDAPAAV
jgi:hypothetical protein